MNIKTGSLMGWAARKAQNAADWYSEKLAGRIRASSPGELFGYLAAVLSGALSLGALALSSVFCIVTSFKLPLDSTSGTAALIFIGAVLLALPCYLPVKRGTAYLASTAALAFVSLLCTKRLYYSFCTALAVISGVYGRALGTDKIILSGAQKGLACDTFAVMLGLFAALVWMPVCTHGRMTGLDIIVLALMLTPCLVIENHVPAPWAIVMLAVSLSCTLLSRAVKKSSAEEGSRTFYMLLLPVLALCIAPVFFRPPERYQPSPRFEQSLDEMIQKLQELFDPDSGELSLTERVSDLTGIGFSLDQQTDREDLSKLGRRRQSGHCVMHIYTTVTGSVYLKGAAMARYENNTWRALDRSAGYKGGTWMTASSSDIEDRELKTGALYMDVNPGKWLASTELQAEKRHIFIKTAKPINVIYYPYFIDDSVYSLCSGNASYLETSIPNTNKTDSYNFSYRPAELPTVTDMVAGGYIGDTYAGDLSSIILEDGGIIIEDGETHSFDKVEFSEANAITDFTYSSISDAYSYFVSENYKNVPDNISDRLFEIAKENGFLDLPKAQRPAAIAEYLKNLGRYDLNTEAVPKGKDFVLWFLENSHRGYCVHFATAATMLLRVCNIPARYVSGYMIYASADEWNEVTSDDAHAWVEYYDDMIGWIPLEVTGSSDQSQTSAVTITTNTSATTTATDPTSPTTAPSAVSSSDRLDDVDAAVSDADDIGSGQEENGDDNHPDTPEHPERGSGAWLLLLLIPAAALLLYARRYLEDRRRQTLRSQGGNNYALLLWTECEKLLAVLGDKPSASMLSVARKAAFSNHTVSDSELASLQAYRDSLESKRSGAVTVPVRIIDKYLRLLY